MKHLLYILTCFLALALFTKVESKPLVNDIHFTQNSLEQKLVKKDLSKRQNAISASFNINDKLYVESFDEADLGERADDNFAFITFDTIISFYSNYKFPTSVLYTESSSHVGTSKTIPFYILFGSIMIPSSN